VVPLSAISNGGKTALCNLGDSPNGGADPGTISVTLRVIAGSALTNGESIILTGGVTTDQTPLAASTPSSSVLVTVLPPLVAGTEPQFDIGKDAALYRESVYGFEKSVLPYLVVPGSDGSTPGRIIPYILYIRAPKTAGGFGPSESLTLEDTFTLLDENNMPVSSSAELWTW
jgi:hypothetical protein